VASKKRREKGQNALITSSLVSIERAHTRASSSREENFEKQGAGW
jgi:hypothetical protein